MYVCEITWNGTKGKGSQIAFVSTALTCKDKAWNEQDASSILAYSMVFGEQQLTLVYWSQTTELATTHMLQMPDLDIKGPDTVRSWQGTLKATTMLLFSSFDPAARGLSGFCWCTVEQPRGQERDAILWKEGRKGLCYQAEWYLSVWDEQRSADLSSSCFQSLSLCSLAPKAQVNCEVNDKRN